MPEANLRTRTKTLVLVDPVRESPVDRELLRKRRQGLLALVILAAVVSLFEVSGL